MLEKFEGEKKKQWAAVGIAVAVGVGALFILQEIMSPKKEKKRVEVPKVKIVDEKKIEEEPFKKVYGRELSLLQKQIEDMQKEMEMMQEMLKEQKYRQQQKMDIYGNAQQMNVYQTENKEGPKIVVPGQADSVRSATVPQTQYVQSAQQLPQKQEKIEVKLMSDLIALEVSPEEDAPTQEQKQTEEKKPETPKTIENTLPAGSFVRAVLLSGLDAPTSGGAVRNPHPVLFKITDKAVLPNKWKMNIRDCFVIGTGYGDLSSERAYIRLERLSCTKSDGSIISKTVDGYVSGEDGKNGLKGRVVSKQGQLLARTLVAGFLDGVSRAFSYSQQRLLVSPQGAVSTVDPNRAFQYAGLSGISEAAKKLADFYMNLVNKTFPVIEILPGRQVDIVFLKDVDLVEE